MIDRLMENPLQSSQAHDIPEMHDKILELKNALQVQSEKTRQGEMDTQRQIILDLLKAKAEAGETQYADLKMKDLRAMKVKQVKDDQPESRSHSSGSGSEYGSSYESETDSDEEKKKEEKDPTASMPDSHWIVDKDKDKDKDEK